MNFPEKLKCFRLEHGYTQAELGKLVGVSDVSISLYEQGKRTPDLYKSVRIATIMGTTCEELVNERRCE
ncbi:MAG: helix-turn-helix domain-containing protein [Alistipes senegalensis]|nr:helix-turn-helix domain-containing protein [Alistipes senegalensis]